MCVPLFNQWLINLLFNAYVKYGEEQQGNLTPYDLIYLLLDNEHINECLNGKRLGREPLQGY